MTGNQFDDEMHDELIPDAGPHTGPATHSSDMRVAVSDKLADVDSVAALAAWPTCRRSRVPRSRTRFLLPTTWCAVSAA